MGDSPHNVREGAANLDAQVVAVRAGDRERYRDIVHACELPVRAVLALMLPDPSAVDDVLCETFLTAYVKLSDYQVGTNLIAWLRAIAKNLALNERRQWRRREAFKGRYRESLAQATDTFVDAIADRLDDQVLAVLRDCLQGLAPTARGLIEQHYFQESSAADISTRLGKPAGWVRLVLHRARAALAKCLGEKATVPAHG